MVFDFSFLLVALAALTGAVWGLDRLFFADKRHARGIAKEPVAVDYARSFFPVIVIVLVLRSFLYEPFRIPSDSMMPTLIQGDFIFVNKWRYGLRLPVLNTKIVPIGEPQRGDVIVFRKPSDPSLVFIKRLVGLPGDTIQVVGSQVLVNGTPSQIAPGELYSGPKNEQYPFTHVGEERLREQDACRPSRPCAARHGGRMAGAAGPLFHDGRQSQQQPRQPLSRTSVSCRKQNVIGKAEAIWLSFNPEPQVAPAVEPHGHRDSLGRKVCCTDSVA